MIFVTIDALRNIDVLSKFLFACSFFSTSLLKFIFAESYLFFIYHGFWDLKNLIVNWANDCYNEWNETESLDRKTNYSQRMTCFPI